MTRCFLTPCCDAAQIYDSFTEDIEPHPTHCGVDNSFGNRDQDPTIEARYVTEVDGTVVVTSTAGHRPLFIAGSPDVPVG